MWRLKSCIRCNGDSFLEKDYYGWYEVCLQCGYRYDLKTAVSVTEKEELHQDETVAVR